MNTNNAAIELLDLEHGKKLASLRLESPLHIIPRVGISFDRQFAAILSSAHSEAGESQLEAWQLPE
jgi:hypothetical protein